MRNHCYPRLRITGTGFGRALAAAAILTTCAGRSDQVLLQPSADARIVTNYPADGQSIYLSVYDRGTNIQRTVMQFNLPTLGATAVITNATLKLFADANLYPTGNPAGQSMEVYRLTRSWSETRVTWTRATSTSSWTKAGGDYVGTGGLPDQNPYASNATLVPDNYTNLSPVELDWNVTGLVQEWDGGKHPNYGLLLLSYPGNGLLLHSRESGTNLPVLQIDTTNAPLVSSFNPAQSSDVLTYHNDNARTGQNLKEEILTPGNVSPNLFGKLWVYPANGKVDAQPLYAAGVSIPGQGQRNVVFIATEHNTVYAYDADSTNLFWYVSLLGAGETQSDTRGCDQVAPEIGITATPVIDRQLGANGTIFVVAMSKDMAGNYYQRLHALDLANGVDLLRPVAVAATYPGNGPNSSNGQLIFDPAQYKERPGLLLLNGVVYTAWSSHCDFDPYNGWIIGYDEHTLAQTSVLNITPNGTEGSIWMSGAGLAADTVNNIYCLAANGTLDVTLTNGLPSLGDYGNAFIKISTASNRLAVTDYFATFDTPYQNTQDLDLGSGGALVLPDMVDAQGQVRQLAVGAGKDQNIYLVDRSNMGKYNSANNNAIYQELPNALVGGIWSMPAYFNGTLYYGAVSQPIQAFPFQSARLEPVSSQTSGAFGYPGATPSVSANINSNGIVWAAENVDPAVLHAYTATDLGNELYNSDQAANGRDQFGTGNKFITPTIASARVYVGTTSGVGVFGLLDQSTLTPLQIWRDNYFHNPSNVGAGANSASPAGDGVPNLVKYALGLNPLTPATPAQLPRGSLTQSSGQQYPTLTVNRAATAPDVSYVAQVSGDSVNWFSGPAYTTTLTDTTTQLVVRDNTPVGAKPRFMRLMVSNP
jgi:hypothetical protein